MATLPPNIERIRDHGGYRYRGYAKDGFCVRLHHDGRNWNGTANLTGRHVGARKTLALMGALLETIVVEHVA